MCRALPSPIGGRRPHPWLPAPYPALVDALSMSTVLDRVLQRQRDRGVLGGADLADQRAHSRSFAMLVDEAPGSVVDLGSGGGVPGLVLAVECWPSSSLVLLDASRRRCTYLELAVAELDLGDRVAVQWARAEEVGRSEDHRGTHDLVVARSFGPPAVTAECAAPLLSVGGALLVSDPPGGAGDRWTGVGSLGLEHRECMEVDGASFSRLVQVALCPDRYPRRPGVPARRPLF